MRRVRDIVGIVLLLCLVAPFIVHAVPQVVGAEHSYVVLSDSMSPTINAGDVVIVNERDPRTIEAGDVITFTPTGGAFADQGAERVTHRVIDVVEENGERRFKTKGDANDRADQQLVPAHAVVGVVQFHIPLVGHLIAFAGTKLGIVAFIILPSVALLLTEAKTLITAMDADEHPEGES